MFSTEIKTMYSKLLYIITLHRYSFNTKCSVLLPQENATYNNVKKVSSNIITPIWVSAVKCNTCFSHDVAEIAGLTAQSFGVEGVDRYIILFKKECPPSEDELATLRDGDEWNEEKAKELAQKVSKL